jgi:hypothetical protein
MVDPSTAIPQEQIALAQSAYRMPIPRLYSNGFITGQTASDIAIVLLTNGVPSATLNLSYESAKSLVKDLSQVVKNHERVTGHPVTDIAENTQKMTSILGEAHVKPKS